MKRLIPCVAALLCWVSPAEESHAGNKSWKYRVTITNATRGQVLSPPVVIRHTRSFELFRVGEPATPELAQLAEDGMTAPLAESIANNPRALIAATGSGPLPPGQSAVFEIATNPYERLSVAAMLVQTNDAFAAANGVSVPWGTHRIALFGYDAGSEANNESCDFIPGPPCGSGGVRATEDAEGFVHVHSGIFGQGDLDPAVYDWRGPVAFLTMERLQ